MQLVEWTWLTLARVQTRLERRAGGQSTVEYALVGALIVIAAAGAMTLLGGEVTNVFTKITNTLSGAASTGR
jgi:Flp pilus assembly pilin Flp